MSWAVRRESILANELSLRSQDDGSFNWLDTSTINIFRDEKISNNPVPQRTLSPASTISSGTSSANNSPCPLNNNNGTGFDEDDDSDAGFESDRSNFDYYVDNDKYSVIDGKAYMIPTIPQPMFTQLQDALSPMAGAAKHLPQALPPRPATPLLTPFHGLQSRSPSPNLPPTTPLPPYNNYSQGKRSRSTHATQAWCNRTSLILTEDSDEGESDGNASDDEYIPSPQLNSKKRLQRDSSPQLDTWSFAGAQNRSNAIPSTPAPIAPHERPTKRVRATPTSRNVQVSSLSQPIDALALSFKCPECGWVQRNKRVPDFKRHLRSHVRPSDGDHSKGWWCKGVLASSIPGFHGEGYQFAGEQRFGGCLKTFSRRDALKRHLDNPNVACLGSVSRWD